MTAKRRLAQPALCVWTESTPTLASVLMIKLVMVVTKVCVGVCIWCLSQVMVVAKVCACIHACMCVHAHVCGCACLCVHACIYVCVCVCDVRV